MTSIVPPMSCLFRGKLPNNLFYNFKQQFQSKVYTTKSNYYFEKKRLVNTGRFSIFLKEAILNAFIKNK